MLLRTKDNIVFGVPHRAISMRAPRTFIAMHQGNTDVGTRRGNAIMRLHV
jgi:hypothetical protein